MANIFTQNPIYLDTDTTTGAGTNWRGANGGAQLNPGNLQSTLQQAASVSRQWGIRPVGILVALATGGTAATAGNIIITDPATTGGAGQLFKFPVTTTLTQQFLDQEAIGSDLWRDFIVTGLTATGTAIQIWYRA